MNNPNPFVPEGSILEQQSKRRSRLKLAVFCVLAVGVAGLSAMLIEGCKRTPTDADNSTPTIDTNAPAVTDTNTPVIDTNAPVVAPAMTNTPAPVVTTPPPQVAPAETEYVVIKGDTLGKIAKKNGVTVKALEAANPGVVPKKLKVGQKLSIPSGSAGANSSAATPDSTDTGSGEVYVVKSGDTLTRIAHSHGTTVKAIESENGLSTTKIKVGEKLKIPGKAAAPAPVAAAPEPTPAPVVTPAPVTTPSTTSTN
jgi:LysM repeat protein